MNRNYLSTYSNMVAVELPTLVQIPSHWTIKPLKYVCDFRSGKAHEPFVDEDGEFICVNSRYVSTKGQKVKFCTRNLTPAFDGDVLMVMSDLPNGRALAKAMYVESENRLAVNQRVCALSSRTVDAKYLYYFLDRNPLFLMHDDGVNQTHLSNATFTRFPVLRPPLKEQKQIAAFLDYETAKIDALIEKQQQLIALLGEKRQAVISHAVTKGLNPDALMRDSGIEWLGEVPEHWTVVAYRHLVKRVVVGIAEAATHAYAETGVPIVRSTNIKTGVVDQSNMLFIKPSFAATLASKALLAGDIVTTRTGANVGVSAVVPGTLHNTQCFTLVISTPKDGSNSEFYRHFINSESGRCYIDLTAWGSGQPNISVPIIQEMHTVSPPRNEQDEIVAYIEEKAGKFDVLISKAEQAVDLLQERRTALISAAVTGKIDVRGWKRPSSDSRLETEMEVA